MDKKTEALKLALEALKEIHVGNMTPMAESNWNKALAVIDEALVDQPAQQCKYGNEPVSCTSSPMDCQCALDAVFEQPAQQQEPTAWLVEFENGEQELHFEEQAVGETITPLYTSPPSSNPLAYAELMALAKKSGIGPENVNGLLQARLEIYGRAIEAAHGIKE